MSAVFETRQNQRDRNQRNTETLIDNVDESFDALVNQVNSYTQTQRRLFNSQFGDGGLTNPYFNNIQMNCCVHFLNQLLLLLMNDN